MSVWTPEALAARMCSGEPFTYGGLSDQRSSDGDLVIGDADRLIDRTIQKLRRKGLIAFKREGGAVVWRATEPKAEGQS